MSLINSAQNAKIKKLQRLVSGPKYRKEENRFVVEGLKIIEQADEGRNLIEEIYYAEGISLPADLETKYPCFAVAPEILAKSLDAVTPQGLAAICRLPEPVALPERGRFILLDDIQDPGNLGAIIRSAVAFDFEGLIISDHSADPYSPKALRSSAGAVLKIPLYSLPPEERLADIFLVWADWNLGAHPDQLNLPADYALVIGNEGRGLSEYFRQRIKTFVKIPVSPRVESLNAAVAASLLMYALSG